MLEKGRIKREISAAMSDKRNDGFKIDFIDPLFAVAIHIGVVESFLREHWIHARSFPRALEDWANIFMFGAGIFVLVASWVGYHLSIKAHALKGNTRFGLDVVLLLAYMLLLLYFRNMTAFAGCLAFIYFIYILWDYFKTREYPGDYYDGHFPANIFNFISSCFLQWMCPASGSRLIGEMVTFGWAVFFVSVVPLVCIAPDNELAKCLFAALVVLTNVCYRFDKKHEAAIIAAIPFKLMIFVFWGLDVLLVAHFSRELWSD